MDQKEKAKDARLRREYGITLEEYYKVLAYQNNSCAICKRPMSTMKSRLALDHDHVTGRCRGLLCWTCNRALASFKDRARLFRNAAEYLEKPPLVTALGREIITAPGRVGTKRRAKQLKKASDSKATTPQPKKGLKKQSEKRKLETKRKSCRKQKSV